MIERLEGVGHTWLGQFGFIRPDDGGRDVYVTRADIEMCGVDRLEIGARYQLESLTDPITGYRRGRFVRPIA